MEWREQSSVSCEEAFVEAQRWIEAVTKKRFGSNDFRSALENGVLLCDLINRIKPGIVRRVNRLPTPIAGLDNLNVFLKACGKLGLKEAQLFHPGDLQDLSTRVTVKHQETDRRLKNVLITIYWLGRRAQCDRFYDGPYLNFKAFEGLLGTALYKALQDSSGQKSSNIRDSGFGDGWYPEREELYHLRGGGGHRRDDSLDSLDSLGSRPQSISSDATLKGSSEGCCSDTEADSVLRMAESKDSLSYRRSVTITPKAIGQFNQFLPTKDKQSGYVPAPLRKKRAERGDDSRRSWASISFVEDEGPLTSQTTISADGCSDSRLSQNAFPTAHPQWGYDYESGSDSDADRPDPDVVLDDLASRRFHSPSPAPPTNFAVPIGPLAGGRVAGGKGDPWAKVTMTPSVASQPNVAPHSESWKTQPPNRGSVKVDHQRAVNTNSLFRDVYEDSEDEDDEVGYADPVQDDLYARKMGIKPQCANSASYDKFLPKFWTPEEDIHVQKIKLGSQRRPWYKKIQGFSRQKSGSSSDDSECDASPWVYSAPLPSSRPPPRPHAHEALAQTALVVGKRQHQAQESPDGSKSTSDIQADAAVARQIRYEELQKFREQIKDSEDKWQDDLSKWKNRRRSVNSDIVKKKEEREKIEQITYGGDRKSTTFKEIEEKRETKRQNSVGSRLGSLSYLDDNDDVFVKPTSSRTQTRPIRGYTIDSPYSSFEPPEPSLKTQELPPAVRPPSRPTSQEPEITNTSITPASRSSQPRATAPLQRSESVDTSRAEGTSSLLKAQEPRRTFLAPQSEPEAPSSVSLHKEAPLLSSMEPKPPGVSRVSASLPRSYQRSDSARITSVVTPRPFGTQSSRITSLPRAFTMDDSQKRVNGNADVPQKTSVPSRYHQYMTSEDEAQSSSAQSSEEEEEKKEMTTAKSISSVLPHVKSEVPISPAPAKEISQGNFCEMRLSLNQKPNSSRDFGFQAAWDSTGARVTSIQPGSPAEMCQLQTGDEVLTVNGHQVAEMSYTAWKSSLEEALQEGSLVMDVRRHGQNSSPETNPVSSSLDFTSRMSAETPPARAPPRHIVDVASNGVNGGLREEPVTMRNKESEPMSLKNLKRRSEFFEQGGSDSAMPDIPVPAITPSSSRWSWDPEAERKRQEKWQQEQERLLQEKYKRDQEKLHEEWLKAQQEIATSKGPQEVAKQSESLKMNSHISPQLPPSSVLEPRPSLWEEEEDEEEEERKRKEEKEKEHQRQVEERMKREEEERELQRLQEDRRRREMQEEEERMRREEEEEREEARRRQEAAEMERREKERAFQQQQWPADSHSFARVQPPLSISDRLKSKSSPQLDEEDKTQRRGAHVQSRSEARWLLEEQLRLTQDIQTQSRRPAWEPEQQHRNGLDAAAFRAPERVTGSGLPDRKSQQSKSQAELERQQILNEMKKKTPLLTDSSWIRQRPPDTDVSKDSDVPPMRRGESLDNLDAPYNSLRSSWTPRSSSFAQNYSQPQSGSLSFYGGGSGVQRPVSAVLPSSYSTGSLRSGAGTHSSWPRHSPSLSPSSPSPATSPEPPSEAGGPQQRSRSVSGKKICTFCDTPLGKGAAMIIESLGLCYHLGCFKCINCKSDLGGSEAGAEVRIRSKQLYCNSCYIRVKTGQPTSM